MADPTNLDPLKSTNFASKVDPLFQGDKPQKVISQETQWNEIVDYLSKWFHKPDTEALAISLCVFVAHQNLSNDPVWLFVIGPSGSGKTSTICNALLSLPATKEVSDLTPSSFISGLTKGKGGSSLLFQLSKIGKSALETQGLLIFKDFSSVLSKRVETRAEIMAIMREVYDGSFNPIKGVKTQGWKGKVSVVAAVTPAIERAWAVQRELGERFVQIRWPREDGVEIAKTAIEQIPNANIIGKFQGMVKKFIDVDTLPNNIPIPVMEELPYLAEMAAIARGTVLRASGTMTIIDVPPCEAPTRIVKAMAQIAMAHAKMFRKDKVDGEDIHIASRIAVDSMPFNRLQIIKSLAEGAQTQADIVKLTGLQYSAVDYSCNDLIALGAIKEISDKANTTYSFTDWFDNIRKKAFKLGDVLTFKK